MAYAEDSKCINVGCEKKCEKLWKCKPCYNRDRKSFGLGVQTPEQRKVYRDTHKQEIKAYNKEWELDNRAHRNTYQKERIRKNPETNRQRVKEWRIHHPNKAKASQLKTNFNLSWEEYLGMWEAQGDQCANCKCELLPSGQKRNSVAVDHCHNTGLNRSLLCSHCNKGLGHFDDNPDLLRAAADYIEKWQTLHQEWIKSKNSKRTEEIDLPSSAFLYQDDIV